MNEPLSTFTAILIFVGAYIAGLLWLALIHKIRGSRYRNEKRTDRALYFKTDLGEFRLDKVHGNFNYKYKGEAKWATVKIEDIKYIHYYQDSEEAGLFEFFLSDWQIWDMYGKYRDVTNICHISLKLHEGSDIQLADIKQYEQREMWLGQFFHDLQIKILKMLKMNQDINVKSHEWMEMIADKFSEYDIPLSIQ